MKNYIKKFLIVCFGAAIIMSINTTVLAKIKLIKFCTLSSEPSIILDQNQQPTSGFDIDLAKALCLEIGADCKFIPQQQIITLAESLNSGECDAWISEITISSQRKPYMDFTKAYYPSGANLIATKSSSFTTTPSSIKHKKIGVQRNSVYETYLDSTYGNDINKIKFANNDNALTALKLNKIDAYIDDITLSKYLMQKKDNKNFRLISLPVQNKSLYLGEGYGIPIKKGNTELLTALNQALDKIKTNGIYDKIIKRYL